MIANMDTPQPSLPWHSALAGGLPTLRTTRLVLRAFEPADAADIQRLAGDVAIARTTLSIPHPYEVGMAEGWIEHQRQQCEAGALVSFAITQHEGGTLVGAVSLVLDGDHRHAELGYWIGRPFWGQGYATEAARAALSYGFGTLELHRIHAAHLANNPASGRVMEKLGMQHEGVLRQHFHKWNHFHDSIQYGILRAEFEATHAE